MAPIQDPNALLKMSDVPESRVGR